MDYVFVVRPGDIVEAVLFTLVVLGMLALFIPVWYSNWKTERAKANRKKEWVDTIGECGIRITLQRRIVKDGKTKKGWHTYPGTPVYLPESETGFTSQQVKDKVAEITKLALLDKAEMQKKPGVTVFYNLEICNWFERGEYTYQRYTDEFKEAVK